MKIFGIIFILSLFVFTPFVNAQELKTLEEVEQFLGVETPEGVDEQKYIDSVNSYFKLSGQSVGYLEGTESCFNYYNLGSIDVDINSEIKSVIPGVPVTFTALITNNNPYPVVDGSLHLKVFRKQTSESFRKINGDHLIDQITILEDINLDSDGVKSFIFNWVPQDYLASGEYYLVPFFTTSGRYNLLGETFKDDIVTNKTEFNVVGESELLYFDRNEVTISGEQYRFIGPPQIVDSESPVNIVVPVINDTDSEKNISVTWNTYKWDSLSKENIVDTKTERISIGPKSFVDVSYSVTDNTYPTYLVTSKLISGETLSLLNTRFKREGIDLPRINYSGILQYPIVKGDDSTTFACLSNIGSLSQIGDASLTISLLNNKGVEIHSYTYDGDITSNLMAVKDVFQSSIDSSSFSVLTSLSYKGEVIDEVKVDYKCERIDPSLCATSFNSAETLDMIVEVLKKNIVVIGGIFFLLFISILVIIMLMVAKHNREEIENKEI